MAAMASERRRARLLFRRSEQRKLAFGPAGGGSDVEAALDERFRQCPDGCGGVTLVVVVDDDVHVRDARVRPLGHPVAPPRPRLGLWPLHAVLALDALVRAEQADVAERG